MGSDYPMITCCSSYCQLPFPVQFSRIEPCAYRKPGQTGKQRLTSGATCDNYMAWLACNLLKLRRFISKKGGEGRVKGLKRMQKLFEESAPVEEMQWKRRRKRNSLL